MLLPFSLVILVAIAHFLRRGNSRHRNTRLAIVVLPNEAIAFQAYRLLQYHGISPEHLAIVGMGYTSPDRVGLIKPVTIAFRSARNLAANSALLGTLLCLVILLMAKIEVNLILIVVMTGLLSGICGAIVGAIVGFLGEGSTASIYRHHLRQGRYLLMMEGAESIVRWGQEILQHYSAPSTHS